MAVRERYQYVVDLVVDNANRALGTFTTGVNSAEASTGRLQGTLGRAGTFMRENLAAGAMAAATAVIGFGVKSVQAFTDTALAAGKMADATGLAVEDASRWTEVAGDIGISGETLTGLFTRLNKAIGDNNPAVKALGIELKRTADGSADVNATMLAAIQAINGIADPTERAQRAQQLFGRGYAEASELIFDSAENVRRKLGEVSEQKVIDQAELEKARRLRESMDNLKDAGEDVALIFGEYLAPAVADLADNVVWLKDEAEDLGGGALVDILNTVDKTVNPVRMLSSGVSDLREQFGGGSDDADDLTASLSEMADADKRAATQANATRAAREAHNAETDRAAMYAEYAAAATQALADADAEAEEEARRNLETTKRLTDEYNDQRDAVDDLIGSKNELVGGDIAIREAQRQAAEAAAQLDETLKNQELTLGEVGAALDSATSDQLAAAQAAADYRAKQLEANGTLVDSKVENQLLREELSKLAAGLDGPLAAALQRYIDLLAAIPTDVNTRVTVNGTPASLPRTGNNGGVAQYRGGTMYHPGGAATFNEPGNPEMAIFPDGQVFMPDMPNGSKVLRMGRRLAPQAASMFGGGGTGLMIVDRGVTHHHYHEYLVVGANGATSGAAQRRVRGMM